MPGTWPRYALEDVRADEAADGARRRPREGAALTQGRFLRLLRDVGVCDNAFTLRDCEALFRRAVFGEGKDNDDGSEAGTGDRGKVSAAEAGSAEMTWDAFLDALSLVVDAKHGARRQAYDTGAWNWDTLMDRHLCPRADALREELRARHRENLRHPRHMVWRLSPPAWVEQLATRVLDQPDVPVPQTDIQ